MDEEVKKIYICGGTSRISGIKELIADRAGAPVEFLDPFRSIAYNENQFDPEYIKDISPIAAVGLGLALRKLGE